MFIYLLIVLDVVLLFFTFSSFSEKKRIIVPTAEAISAFLCLFSVTSGILWIFEGFTVEICLLAVTLLVALIFTAVYLKSPVKGKDFFCISGIKSDYRVILNRTAIFIAFLFSLGAYSTSGIGFNDGNAQAVAASILNGNNKLEFEINEYANIDRDSDYAAYFFDTISNIDKENFTADASLSYDEAVGTQKMYLKYGCNPVYPSLLALSAKVFGTDRMALIQAVFAFCMLVFVDEILKALRCDWKLRSLLILLLGASPVSVYCNHTTLVEPVLGFCMVLFFYYLLCRENKLQILSAAGVVTYAFLHTGVYTMLPLFACAYVMYYIHTRKKRHLVSLGISTAGYVLGFIFLNIVAFENTSINYRLGMPFFKEKYFVFVIIFAVLVIIASIVLPVLFSDIDKEKMTEFERGKGQKIFKIFIAVCTGISIILMIVRNIKTGSVSGTLNISILAFAVCTGVLILPLVVVRLVSCTYTAGIKEAVVVVSFVYTVLLYSSVMKTSFDGYFYESRYLATYIPFVIIAGGMMLKLFKKESKFLIPAAGVLLLLIPFSAFLFSPKAETRIEKDAYDGVIESIKENTNEESIVFIEKDLMKYFYYPLINATDAGIYPMEADQLDSFRNSFMNVSDKVFYITESWNNNYKYGSDEKFAAMNITGGFSKEFYDEYVKENTDENEEDEEVKILDKTSSMLGLPHERFESKPNIVRVLKFDALTDVREDAGAVQIKMDDLKLSVCGISFAEGDIAYVTVKAVDPDTKYLNDDFWISYHLDYEQSDDVYECQRIYMGRFLNECYTFELDLSGLNEGVYVTFDVVKDKVAWYSWEHDAPVIKFSRGEDGTLGLTY